MFDTMTMINNDTSTRAPPSLGAARKVGVDTDIQEVLIGLRYILLAPMEVVDRPLVRL